MNGIPSWQSRPNQPGIPSSPDARETERQEFACLPRLPAILTDVQTGWRLNCSTESVGILVREEMLIPLGGAEAGDAKRFAAVHIEQLAQNREWLDKASDVIYKSRGKVSDCK